MLGLRLPSKAGSTLSGTQQPKGTEEQGRGNRGAGLRLHRATDSRLTLAPVLSKEAAGARRGSRPPGRRQWLPVPEETGFEGRHTQELGADRGLSTRGQGQGWPTTSTAVQGPQQARRPPPHRTHLPTPGSVWVIRELLSRLPGNLTPASQVGLLPPSPEPTAPVTGSHRDMCPPAHLQGPHRSPAGLPVPGGQDVIQKEPELAGGAASTPPPELGPQPPPLPRAGLQDCVPSSGGDLSPLCFLPCVPYTKTGCPTPNPNRLGLGLQRAPCHPRGGQGP